MRVRRRILKMLVVLTGIYLFGALLISIDGMNEEIFNCDVIVVLGNHVNSDGAPSSRLSARLDRAVDLYKEKNSSRIFVSGGIGSTGFDEGIVMSRYLVAKGIPQSAIIIDSQGTNTMKTAQNLSRFMRANHLSSTLVVSQFFHISRSKLALRVNGVKQIGSAYARYTEFRDVYSLAREVPAYISYLF